MTKRPHYSYNKPDQRRFVCPVCGTRMDMPKWKHTKTKAGHKKTAYCFVCKETRDLIQTDETGGWLSDDETETQQDRDTPPQDHDSR